ncbi:hypothetical protein ONO23_00619 [Micromonospora noduli]|uniref:Uncharacterized protein n=2 Tax=Micromonospora noduli TaxID=709876 RepID=A0A328MWQ9_9ACTN|nr:hypothetical protein LAH08_05147 [Micromonospora noduli]RAO10264.1 hypothetical protein MED15_05480 [Micromonospora noduli]RAO38933.1 hypothetical protein ONO23_00619 [Micromonospora noduli]
MNVMDQETARQRWHQEHVGSWLQLIATLQSEGWEAHLTCAAAPVQVEGSLPNGELFYFRARHSEVSLGIGGHDPADIPEWEETESHTEASWLPAAEGETTIRRLAFRYAQQSNPTQ